MYEKTVWTTLLINPLCLDCLLVCARARARVCVCVCVCVCMCVCMKQMYEKTVWTTLLINPLCLDGLLVSVCVCVGGGWWCSPGQGSPTSAPDIVVSDIVHLRNERTNKWSNIWSDKLYVMLWSEAVQPFTNFCSSTCLGSIRDYCTPT
jgi:hypothetical protein